MSAHELMSYYICVIYRTIIVCLFCELKNILNDLIRSKSSMMHYNKQSPIIEFSFLSNLIFSLL